jgi:hypothetical protein
MLEGELMSDEKSIPLSAVIAEAHRAGRMARDSEVFALIEQHQQAQGRHNSEVNALRSDLESATARIAEFESQLAEVREREAGAASFLTRAENAERELQGANNQLWGKTQETTNLTNELAAANERLDLLRRGSANKTEVLNITNGERRNLVLRLEACNEWYEKEKRRREEAQAELAAEVEKTAKALYALDRMIPDLVLPLGLPFDRLRRWHRVASEALGGSPPVPAVAETAEKPPETKKPDPWAAEEDRRIFLQAGAPDNPSSEQIRRAHAIHYEEPPPAPAPVERLTLSPVPACAADCKRGIYNHVVTLPINGKCRTIDACIHHIIAALNAGGVETAASCCGHGEQPGRITLADGRELIVTTETSAQAMFTTTALPSDLDRFGVSASDERIVDEMMHKAAEGRAERPMK